MTAALAPLFAAACLLPAAPSAAAAHPQHVTLAEAEWNERAKTLEVALQITPSQLEEVTERHAGRPVDLDADEADAAVAAWLRTAFVVTPADPEPADERRSPDRRSQDERRPEPAKLKWVGKEVGISAAWVYFEVPLPDGWAGVAVADRIRLDAEPAQHNTLVLSVTRPGPDGRPEKLRAAYTFDRRTPSHVLRPADLKPLKRRPAPAAPGANDD